MDDPTPRWDDETLQLLVDQLLEQQGDPYDIDPAPYPHEVIDERGAQDDAAEGWGGGARPRALRQLRSEAVAAGLAYARAGTFVGVGYCLRETRELLCVGPLWPDATTAYEQATDTHKGQPGDGDPFGVPLWWTNNGPGHVALDIRRPGLCLTTDYVATGRWGVAPVEFLADWCDGTFRGWSGDINGQTIWAQGDPFTRDDRRELRERLVRNALHRAIDNDAPQRRIDELRRWLDQLRG